MRDEDSPTERCRRRSRCRVLRFCLLVGALGALAPASVDAQDGDPARIQVGDRIRFRMPGAIQVGGDFHGWRSDVMLIGVEGIENDWPVSVFDMVTLDLFTDRTPREGLRHFAIVGAITGLFIGAGAGLGLYQVGALGERGRAQEEVMQIAIGGAGLGALVGVLGGAVYGSRRPGRGWIQIALPGG